jgi:hypothetical protein
MQSIAQKSSKCTLRAKIAVVIKVFIITLIAIQFAVEPTPVEQKPQKIQCRTLFEQLDCSLKFGFHAVDWGCV